MTGRKKELFKTAKGKYVAPAPIEGRLGEDPLIELSLVSGAGQPERLCLGGFATAPALENLTLERH